MYSWSGPSRYGVGVGKALLMAGTALVLIAANSGHARAQASPQELQNKIDRLEQELQSMKGQLQGVVQQQQKQETAAASSPGVKVSTGGGLKIETTDGNFVGQFGGRILMDTAFYNQDKTRLGDGAEFRSVRLEASGKVYRDWIFKLQADFGAGINSGSAQMKDTYLGYTGIKPLELIVGNFLEPISLDALISNKYTTFMEPALPQQTVPDRRIGVQATARGSNWTAAAAAFGASADTVANDPGNEGDSGFDLSARVTYAPILEKDRVLHFGFGINDRNPQSESLRYRSRPESHITGARFVDTGNLANVDNAITLQPEIAAVLGPFSVQGEYQRLQVNRGNISDDLTFNGWYAQASYILTGESRPYLLNDQPYSGDFGRVVPKRSLMDGGPGAWEVAVRYSAINLTDGSVRGGGEKDITVGLNWYAISNVRFMLNYVKVNTDNDANGNAANVLPGQTNGRSDDPSIVQARAQVDF